MSSVVVVRSTPPHDWLPTAMGTDEHLSLMECCVAFTDFVSPESLLTDHTSGPQCLRIIVIIPHVLGRHHAK